MQKNMLDQMKDKYLDKYCYIKVKVKDIKDIDNQAAYIINDIYPITYNEVFRLMKDDVKAED